MRYIVLYWKGEECRTLLDGDLFVCVGGQPGGKLEPFYWTKKDSAERIAAQWKAEVPGVTAAKVEEVP